MARRDRGGSTAGRVIATVAVVALAAGVIGLSYLALQQGKPASADGSAAPVPTFTLGVSTSSPTATSSAGTAPTTAPGADERFLTIADGVIWRGTAGECGEQPPTIERSNDAGKTWVDVTPTYRDIAQLRGIDPFADTEAEIVGDFGDECETQAMRTFTGGEFWAPYPEVLASSRYLDGSSAITPDGDIDAPCASPSNIRASGDTVAIICDATGYTLTGREWSPLPAEDVDALYVSESTILVAHKAASCDGTTITSYAGTTASNLTCIAAANPSSPAALSASHLWSGDEIFTLPAG